MLDTNVLVAALRSRRGASFAIVAALPSPEWTPVLSVPLYLQYQDVLLRPGMVPPVFTSQEIRGFCRYLASIAHHQQVYFLWRPHLHDAGDEMVLEVAVASQARYIVTHDVRDFRAAEGFGVTPIRPADFLTVLRSLA